LQGGEASGDRDAAISPVTWTAKDVKEEYGVPVAPHDFLDVSTKAELRSCSTCRLPHWGHLTFLCSSYSRNVWFSEKCWPHSRQTKS
jgi:hypothetical protein